MSTPRKDFAVCCGITRRHSKSFYWAFRGLPREKADAVWAIYTFCRRLDDAVDEGGDPEAVGRIAAEWAAFCAGNTPDTPHWRALRVVFDRFAMDRVPFDGMFEGQRMDLAFAQPQDDNELLRYCALVAGTVGQMLLPVLARKNAFSLGTAAVQLGQAMQLTNILRDVGEDLRRGRIYFSRQTMERFGVTGAMLAAEQPSKEFIGMWEYYAQMAATLYRAALAELPLYDEDSRAAVRNSALVYAAILQKIRHNGYSCLQNRVSLSFWEKLKLIRTGKHDEKHMGFDAVAGLYRADRGLGDTAAKQGETGA